MFFLYYRLKNRLQNENNHNLLGNLNKSVAHIFLLLILTCLSVSGQDYVVDIQYFSVEQGLSHRGVNHVFQDSKDFIWVGTDYGLNRFTGHNFQIFSKEKNGLTSNRVGGILEDKEAWLWVIDSENTPNVKNLSFIHTSTMEVKSAEERFGDNWILKNKNIYSIRGDKEQNIFLSTSSGIFKYANGEFIRLAIEEDEKVILNFISAKERCIYAEVGDFFETQKLVKFDFKGNAVPLWTITDRRASGIHVSEETGIHFYGFRESRLFKISPEGQIQKTLKLDDIFSTAGLQGPTDLLPWMRPQFADGELQYWIGDNSRFALINDRKVLFDLNELRPEIAKSIHSSFFFDNQENLWIGTRAGLYKIRLNKNPFKNYFSLLKRDYTISDGLSTRGLLNYGDRLWVNSTMEKQYLLSLSTNEANALPVIPEGKRYPVYRPLTQLDDSTVLTATEEIYVYKNEQPEETYFWKTGNEKTMLWSLFQDAKQELWGGTLDQGLARLEADSIVFFRKNNEFKELARSSVYHFLPWDTEHVFIASTTGVYLLHIDKGILRRFSPSSESSSYIPYDIIYHLHRDKEDPDRIWMATGGGGLISVAVNAEDWSIRSGSLKQFTIVDGLSHNVIYAVYEDDFKNLWIPSDYGVMRFDKTTANAKAYTEADGLPHNEFNRISHFQAPDGRIFFGTLNGVASFYPSQLLGIEESFNVPLRITDFQQFIGSENRLESKVEELLETGEITLQPEDKFFNLEFALLEYEDAGRIKYSYRIKEQSEDWEYLNDNRLRISGLSYGNSTLEVRAQGVSGQVSESKILIPIAVLKPVYLRWWFITAGLLLIASGVFYLYRRRTRFLEEQRTILREMVKDQTKILQEQAEELQGLDKLKSRFFANVSHELRTPLTLMLGPIDATLKENKLSENAYTNLQLAKVNGARLNRLINEILDLSKLESGKLEVESSTLNWYGFLKNIVAGFESLAGQKEVRFSFEYQGKESLLVSTDKRKVEIILLNLLSNAFKFTQKHGRIHFAAAEKSGHLEVRVKDSGRGIHPEDLPKIFDRFYQTKFKNATAEGGTGIGLALTNEFVKLLKGKIEVKSELGAGTEFIVRLPKHEVIHAIEAPTDTLETQAEVPVAQNTRPDSTHTATPVVRKGTILLVEDNTDLRDFISSLLHPNYEVIKAEDGLSALDEITRLQQETKLPDLIITDLMMPVMDGYQFIDKLKRDTVLARLPVLVLSARAGLEDKLRALRIGIDDYLTKPFVEEELFARVENLLRNAKNRRLAVLTEVEPSEGQAEPVERVMDETTRDWLADLENTILDNIENPNYTMEQLAVSMAISKRQLSRRIKELIGTSPAEYLKTIRFARASALLEERRYDTVKAVALSVGFKDIAHFSRQFRKRYGKNPSEYLN